MSDLQRSRCLCAARALVVGTACAAFLTVAPDAAATPNYPSVIASTLKLKAVPHCTLCHAIDNPTAASTTVATSFGRWLYNTELLRANEDSGLKALLQGNALKSHDSDGDGISDHQELVNGTDPNIRNVVKPPPAQVVVDGGSDAGPVVDGGTVFVPVGPVEPEPPQPPVLQTGCSVGAGAASSSQYGVIVTLGLVVLVFRRRRTA